MIIYRDVDTVWINATNGVTVYFGYDLHEGKVSGRVKTPCGVSQIDYLPIKTQTYREGRSRLRNLTQKDADALFNKVKSWEGNQSQPLDYFLQVSHKEPF